MFRGSDNVLNWILNFDFIKVDYTVGGCPGCRVHQGFHAAYNSLSVEMESYMLEMVARYPGARIVVSGHSLGAAEAVFAAMAYQDLGFDVNLYTYGQPRVGDINFVDF
eukprot:CAMPEP_0170543228 /NCGR_PEP_ID=MMETSP0211-20121228/2417_1 /TAXON_ID=311385 /ORGANISM="Pseudokeronopsis sp., Strain OXSARD2" /LENGTH=107 /DNA_ID=CAMNT_0010846551 /DNA_START=425 /DNA_END=748 /DNA_ORIENTATION=-